ncbi:MAG: hypothetical protein ACOCQY_02485 [Halorhabdus sp.]
MKSRRAAGSYGYDEGRAWTDVSLNAQGRNMASEATGKQYVFIIETTQEETTPSWKSSQQSSPSFQQKQRHWTVPLLEFKSKSVGSYSRDQSADR